MPKRDERAAIREVALAVAREIVGERAKECEPLSRHGTFGVGGPADVWVTAESEAEITRLVMACWERQVPLLFVGNGTNTLYADAGASGIVARVAIEHIAFEPLSADQLELRVGAGVSLPALVKELTPLGWAGLEWGVGVPGTVGGAIVSNAGIHEGCAADTVRSVRTVLAPGAEGGAPDRVTTRVLAVDELELGYRQSRFRSERTVTFDDNGQPHAAPRSLIEPQEIITEAVFLLNRDDPAAISSRAKTYLRHRKATQPPQKSAGSVFKNPKPLGAGKLIEDAGLRPHRVGGAEISEKHANFIINVGGARAAHVATLIALARSTVRERYHVEMELELEPRGDW